MLFLLYSRGLFFGRIFFSALVVAVFAGGCGSPYFSPSNIEYKNTALVTVNDTIIFYATDLVRRLDRSGMHRGGGFVDSSEAYDTLKDMIIDSLVSLKAYDFDLTTNPAIYREYERNVRVLLKDRLLFGFFSETVQVDSSEAVEYYYGRPDLYTYKARCNIAHIVLSRDGYRQGADSSKYRAMLDEELDSLIYRKLRVIKKGIRDSLSFGRAAKTYSMDRRRGKFGGRIGWVERFGLCSEIEELVYDKRVPLLTTLGPVATRDGVHLIFIYDRMFMGIPNLTFDNFEMVSDYLKGIEIRKQATLLIDSLREEYAITYSDSAINMDPHKLDTMHWVVVSEAFDTVRIRDCLGQLDLLEMGVQGRKATAAQRRQVFEKFTIDLLFVRAAKDLGIEEWPEVVESKGKINQRLARAVILRFRTLSTVGITDNEALQYYENHQSDYVIERPLRIQHIVLEDSLLAEEVRLKALSGADMLE
ncbi:MAG: peptidylprolyl isomerase, partial [candidate division Zixibacteria bacterium]|nr:peptidylprolyl isomerase [candidate division Zixibacteria bacterium]